MDFLSLVLAAAALQEGSWRVGPAPEWLAPPLEVPAAPALGPDGEPLRWLVYETQLDARGEHPERWQRTLRTFVDEVDVREGAQVTIDFDPEHEELLLHVLALERVEAGSVRRIDQLVPERFTLLRREGGLEAQLLDGTHTLVAWLDDVRAGDRLELAYTVRGQNPVFDGHFMGAVLLRWSVALGSYRHRILWPDARSLHHLALGPALEDGREPSVTRHDGWSELVWEGAMLPAVPFEDSLPAGFDAYAWVQLSDFTSWSEVLEWALVHYALPAEPAPALEALAQELSLGRESPLERLSAALRWTQDEVRYFGLELGPDSHEPSPPALVLQRRFGDCKDKSLLLVALLRQLGIEADPALVSAGRRERVAALWPSILAFDHMIVRATVEGRELWLDPTLLHQRAAPETLGCAPYGRALVVAPGRSELASVPGCESEEPDQVIRVRVDARQEPVLLEVHSRYEGRAADLRRSHLRTTPREELGRSYLRYYASRYPSIELLEAPLVDEDDGTGRIEVRERYRVPRFWKEREGGRSATIEPLELSESVVTPSVRARRGPLALGHPVHLRYEMEFVGSAPWRVTPAQESVLGPGVHLRSRLSSEGERMRLEWDYRTSAPEVSVERLDDYLEWLERAEEELVWTIKPPGEALAEAALPMLADVRWPAVLGLCTLFVLSLGCGVLLWVLNPGFGPPPQPLVGPVGLGGWCILLGLRVAGTALGTAASLILLAPALSRGGWEQLTDPSAPGTLAPWLLVVALLSWSVCSPLTLLLVPAFLAKKRFFRPTFVVLSFVTLLASLPLVPLAMSENDPSPLIESAGQLVWTVGFALYVLRSARVRNTFVR